MNDMIRASIARAEAEAVAAEAAYQAAETERLGRAYPSSTPETTEARTAQNHVER
ncbi:hypothetical protein HZZ00_37215 (plasmid) [Streptomyces sp. NEAU-sy36]|uniref:hypothetical protein n=1 Tax=unclassified Streptomyces TaxID=2593676 RepID=UPI0015D5F01D|nr:MULTISPECIES: hypothetical protein [unclassified Streptomyces]QLJ06674.1 hypothetical protein HZZ00_37215 [Streptomyces sp. NEAU-sy36]